MIIKRKITDIEVGSIFKLSNNKNLYMRIKPINDLEVSKYDQYAIDLKTGNIAFSNIEDDFEFEIYRYGPEI